jgi:hypothetical protein
MSITTVNVIFVRQVLFIAAQEVKAAAKMSNGKSPPVLKNAL